MRVNVNANGHVYGQVSMEEPEKNALYHEPFNNLNMYPMRVDNHLLPRHPDYAAQLQLSKYQISILIFLADSLLQMLSLIFMFGD